MLEGFEHEEELETSSSSDSESGNEHASFPIAKRNLLFGRKEPVHAMLGGGKVADIVLWRKKQLSARILAGVTITWFTIVFSGIHLLSLLSHLLIVSLTVLFFWSKCAAIFEKALPEVPEISLPEHLFLDAACVLDRVLNRAVKSFRSIAFEKECTKLLVVITVLWMLAVVGIFLTLYILPAIYEKYEKHVETAGHTVMTNLYRHSATIESKIIYKITRCSYKNQQ